MSKYELKHESGSLWRNENKKSETHADYNGSAKIDGKDYFMDAWINEASNGKKYMKLRFKAKDEMAQKAPEPEAPASLDDEIPF